MSSNDRYTHRSLTENYYNKRFGDDFSLDITEEETLRYNLIKKEIQFLLRLNPIERPSILDVGCGNGRLSQGLSKFGRVTGLDLASRAIEEARKNFPDVRFINGDVTDPIIIKNLQEKFNIVVCSEVIEHVDNQDALLEHIKDLVEVGGYLILTTPNGKWYDQYFQKGRIKSDQPFENWLSKKDLVDKIYQVGFQSIVKRKTFRSEWIFKFQTRGFLHLIGNRYFHRFLIVTTLYEPFITLTNRFGLGINLYILARK